MKESLQKITGWVKAHPYLSGVIALVLVVIGYFVLKSSGGNASGETIPGADTPSGVDEAGGSAMDLSGLGTSAGAMPATTSAQPAESNISSATPAASYDSFDTSSLGSDPFDMGTASYFDTAPGLVSSPTTSAAIVSNVAKVSGVAKAAIEPIKGQQMKVSSAAVIKPVVKVATVARAANPISGTVSKVNTPLPAGNSFAGAMLGVKATPNVTVKPKSIINQPPTYGAPNNFIPPPVFGSVLKSPTKPAPKPATPAFSLTKYSGFHAGYVWNGKQYNKIIGGR